MWGNVFGIKGGQKITDETHTEIIQAYNPGNYMEIL